MTDEEKTERISTIEKFTTEECIVRLDQLKDIRQVDLSDIEKAEYIILKWRVKGKRAFFEDSYVATLLQELIFFWIEEESEIPELFSTLFLMLHIDWLIDWENSTKTLVKVRQDIINNMHTFINPFLEEIEEILDENYNSRNRRNTNDRIVSVVEELLTYNNTDKLPFIYNALFKVKYALQGAKEYMESNNKKSINVNSTEYTLDIQSVAHILLRHTNRFKTLSHKDNSGKRGFMNNGLGDEYEELDRLLNTIEQNASNAHGGIITCQIETHNYKMIIRSGRIVTLYPLD